MADFTRPIPPVSPAEYGPVEYPPAGGDAARGRPGPSRRERKPAAKAPGEADEPGEAEPEHQLDESV